MTPFNGARFTPLLCFKYVFNGGEMNNLSDSIDDYFIPISNKLNICSEVLDNHLNTPIEHYIALRYLPPEWEPENDKVMDVSYRDLFFKSMQVSLLLDSLGVKKGKVLFTLTPRIPELFYVALGALRQGIIFSPLFSAFGPEPILSRMIKGEGEVLFSLSSIYRKKILPIRKKLTSLKYVLLVNDDGRIDDLDEVIDFQKILLDFKPSVFVTKTFPDDPAILHFTSGTTGEPKGALHVHKAIAYHKFSANLVFDLKPGDIFWCTADPGWVTGTSYGIIAPLALGATIILDGSEFNAKRWCDILNLKKVNVWYTSPTALRMLMKAGDELALSYDFPNLRYSASVGEPLNPEVIKWARSKLRTLIHDNWWQTETGGIMIANYQGIETKIGSMGKPLPGLEIKLIKSREHNNIIFSRTGEMGEIAIKKNWPSVFVSYLKNPERYEASFFENWYLSGDLATMDEDGYFWFMGRKDDVIKTSGHLIGPFEVENILMEHPAVLEAAVIGIPDSVIGEVIKAWVVLKKNVSPSNETRLNILSHARNKLGPALAPREIEFIDDLPKTRSGKIMRRLLKARLLGLPEGDTSTLESSP